METRHIPVLAEEVLEALEVQPGGRYCDGTVGGAGHALQILERSAPTGQLLCLDRDPQAIQRARQRLAPFGQRITLCHRNFAELVDLLTELGMAPLDGLLLDLGVSSFQLDEPERGFAFSSNGPLDMRMDPTTGRTAAELIASLSEAELSQVIHRYGEEPSSTRIARAIKRASRDGDLSGTADLARVVSSALDRRGPRRGSTIHPATRTFMALRMAVNDEIGSLRRFLDTFTEALRPRGRVAVISFHSLEDRAVKQTLSRLANPCVCPPSLPVCACDRKPSVALLTRKPIRPGEAERERNPRSRSARLRVAELI
jgi:16S rRNA (cytosine1402-N4)-methyltransferase